MSELDLGTPAAALMDRHADLHKVLRTLELQTRCSYVSAYEKFARSATGGQTVWQALEAAGVRDFTAFETDLKTLERAALEKERLEQRITRMLDAAGASPTMEGDGRQVGADRQTQAPRISDDDYAAVRSAAPKPDWRRLRRAQRLPGGAQFQGELGEHHFAQQDLMHAHSGVDYVAHLEQMRARSAAVAAAQAGVAALDEAVQAGKTPTDRRRLLEAAVGDANRLLDRDPSVDAPRALEGLTARPGVRHLPLVPLDGGDR